MPVTPMAVPADDHQSTEHDQDAEYARRWSAWQARGRVHERAVRRRFGITAIVTAVVAVAAYLAYGLST
jgi:hypothetical protein